MTQSDRSLTEDELRTLEGLLDRLDGPGAELPWPLFRFVTEVAATSNIDLLVRDERQRVLLSWRDDPFGSGWHVPGSIIRHREEIAHRLAACAKDEFGCAIQASDGPVALVEIFDDRGHSVSLCYTATLRGTPTKPIIDADDTPQGGDLRWFETPPEHLYPSHLVYRDVIAALAADRSDDGIPVFTQHVGRRDVGQTSEAGAITADASLTNVA